VGITSLAVASFLSDGHSQTGGRYSDSANRGINYVLSCRDREGRFGWQENSPGISLFNQSTAVLVLAENFIQSQGLNEDALTQGIKALMDMTSSSEKGRDLSEHDAYSDTWAAMALRTSVLTGIKISGLQDSVAKAEEKVALLARNETQGNAHVTASLPPLCSASEGALTALFEEGKKGEEEELDPDMLPFPDKGDPSTLFGFLDKPDFREPSFLFFTGTALCEDGGLIWHRWNERVKSILLDDQEQNGLWVVEGDWPWVDGGDIYTTALHLLTLQVYYRYIKLEENCN